MSAYNLGDNLKRTMINQAIHMDILLIEDREDEVKMAEQALTECKVQNRMLVAKSASEAIMYLKQVASAGPYESETEASIPGLILLDVNMTGKRGFDILHELRTDPQLMTIPIVILTNSLEEMDLTCSMSHGVTGYFLKPVDSKQLKKVIKDVEEHWSLLQAPPCAN